VFNCPYGLGLVENICARGSWAGFNLRDGNIKNCMAYENTRGVNVSGGGVNLIGENCACQCVHGLIGIGTLTAFDQTYLNACTNAITPSGSGFAIGSLTMGMDLSVVYAVRNITVCNAGGGTLLQGGSFLYVYNDVGFHASMQANLIMGAGPYPMIPGNNGIDLKADTMALIQYDRHGGPVPTADPVAEAAPDGAHTYAFIHVLNT